MRERAQRFESRQNMKEKNFEVFHYRDLKPNGVEVHDHDFYEVYFLLNGDVSYWVEGQTYRLEPGDFLLINPTTLHRPVFDENNKVYERIVLWINKEYLESFKAGNYTLSRCFEKISNDKTNLIRASSSAALAELTACLAKLVREYYGKDFANGLYSEGIFIQFMVELNRIVLNCPSEQEEGARSSELISDMLEYINRNYDKDLSLEELSTHFFVSKYYLSHEFKKSVGTGVYRYIMLKRLSVAKQLLYDNVPANEVCFKCGFRDYTNFFRAFKAEYGISPGGLKR